MIIRSGDLAPAANPTPTDLTSPAISQSASLIEMPAGLSGHANAVVAVCISPDSRTVFSASHDATIRVWEVATGHEVLKIPTETPVNSLAINWSLRGEMTSSAFTNFRQES